VVPSTNDVVSASSFPGVKEGKGGYWEKRPLFFPHLLYHHGASTRHVNSTNNEQAEQQHFYFSFSFFFF
jgi:hypothetical protein